MEPAADPSWGNYPQTILEFPTGLTVDLRNPVTPTLRAQLNHLSVLIPFAIISAANAKGQENQDNTNRASFSAFCNDILTRKLPALPVQGKSADGKYAELGLAIHTSVENARRIAQSADQSAFFWYDGTAFWLMGGLVETQPLCLPSR
jgi:Protein of unknown function (DUF3293)